MIVYKNRGYIETFVEHAMFLIENSNHEVWCVYRNSKNKPMERLNKENYKIICEEIEKDIEQQLMTDRLYIVSDISDLEISTYTDSYQRVFVEINQTLDYYKRGLNWDL